MPTVLGQRFAPSWLGIPPHMSPLDLGLWRRWAPTNLPLYTNIYYDVGLGDGRPAPPNTPDTLKDMWLRLNQKRADVVLENAAGWTILELRHAANANALGRLHMYGQLWDQNPPDSRKRALLLVTDTHDPDVEAIAPSLNITYEVF